jgi:hypothetical protein
MGVLVLSDIAATMGMRKIAKILSRVMTEPISPLELIYFDKKIGM